MANIEVESMNIVQEETRTRKEAVEVTKKTGHLEILMKDFIDMKGRLDQKRKEKTNI